MHPMFSPEGEAALAALMTHRPLLAFDFDGTLAPIVAFPDAARIDPTLAAAMAELSRRCPVAIVTGRAVADVRPRLGFEPRFVVGNHGAEDEHNPVAGVEHAAAALAPLRARLAAEASMLEALGVWVEDKGASIALHYRLSPRPLQAHATIMAALRTLGVPTGQAPLRVFEGKMVVNAMPADAPDKADAVHRLVERCGAGAALFAGDDLNDEPVFAAAEPHWLTLRVGASELPTAARFGLPGPEDMLALVSRLLVLAGRPGPTEV